MLCIICLLFLAGCSTNQNVSQVKSQIYKVSAASQKGFSFPYYLYIPSTIVTNLGKDIPLIVVPNNTGTTTDDLAIHERRVVRDLDGSTKDLSEESGLPVLMPVFPRPETQWQIYTHSLDRDSLLVKDGPLKRLDLQLISMVNDARPFFKSKGIQLLKKFLINGYSASGTFSNRFPFLHPKLVLGVASGGVNGIPTLPVNKLNKKELPYPIGTSDIESLTGQSFDFESYQKIPQYIYMGAKDDNDTVPYRDAWSEEEAKLIKSVLPTRMMPNRWEECISIYKEKKVNATFKTYKKYGHEYNRKIRRDIAEFFSNLY